MGQQDVINFLEAYPKNWFTAREISQKTNKSHNTVMSSLRRLRERNEIEFKPKERLKGETPQWVYRYKP